MLTADSPSVGPGTGGCVTLRLVPSANMYIAENNSFLFVCP